MARIRTGGTRETRYEGKACGKCGGTERRRCNNCCIECERVRANARHKRQYVPHPRPVLRPYVPHPRKPLPIERRKAWTLTNAAALRAKKRGLPFTITSQWVENKLKAGKCERTGIPFNISRGPGGLPGPRSPWSPSLDRINPQLGYTEDNTQVVVWAYNAAKGTWGDEEVLMVARAVLERN